MARLGRRQPSNVFITNNITVQAVAVTGTAAIFGDGTFDAPSFFYEAFATATIVGTGSITSSSITTGYGAIVGTSAITGASRLDINDGAGYIAGTGFITATFSLTVNGTATIEGGGVWYAEGLAPEPVVLPTAIGPRIPAPQFQFLVEDIMSGIVKTQDFPLDAWSYNDTLNRAGALQGSVAITSDFATEEMLDPWRTAVYVMREGRIEWGGILTPPTLGVGDSALSVNCFGWLGYWDRRVIRTPYQPLEAGGNKAFPPNRDVTASHVFGAPDTGNLWANVVSPSKANQGVIASGIAGDVPGYLANFAVTPGLLSLHPILSITLGIVATGATSPRSLTPQVKIGANTYAGVPTQTVVGGATNCSYTWTVNPATGVAWLPSEVEAFVSGNSGGFFTDPNAIGFDTILNWLFLSVRYDDGNALNATTDQFDIFRSLILGAQAVGFGYDLGIGVGWDALSGVLRDRSEDYRVFSAKNLGEALRQLAAVDNGFDFAMTYALNATTDRIDKAIRLFFPHKGRDTHYLFEYARGKRTNVLSRGFADPVEFAWTGDGWGSGNDETRLKAPYIDPSLLNLYPPYDAAPTFSSVIEPATLAANTQAFFARRNRPRRIPILRVNPEQSPRWGDAEIGDTVGVHISDGYGSTPGVVPQRMRITGTKVSADGGYDLVLADPLLDEQDAN